MFEGTQKKVFHCRRCMLKDTRRRFLSGEDFVHVEFQEMKANSRNLSPHGHNNSLHNHSMEVGAIQHENNVLQDNPIYKEDLKKIEFSCKRCLHHHQAYEKREHLMEHPIALPLLFDREEDRTLENAPRNTTDSLRGLNTRSPSPVGRRWVPHSSERLSDKWKEEHLSLRFSDTSLTDCMNCLHHHGFDTTNYVQKAKDKYHLRQSFPLIGSEGNLEAKEFPPSNISGELVQKENKCGWWETSKEGCGGACRRCSSHHKNHEKLLKLNGLIEQKLANNHILRVQQEHKRKEGMDNSNSSPEFATPTQNFSRSRTPTPQRLYNYQELYERRLQGGGASKRNNNLVEVPKPWNPPRKLTNHHNAEYTSQCKLPIPTRKHDNNRAGSPTPWNLEKMTPSQKSSPGTLLQQCHALQGMTPAQPMMKHVKNTRADSQSKSPKWSEECLHKRELTRHKMKRIIDRITMIEKGCAISGVKYEKLLVGRSKNVSHSQGRESTTRIGSPKLERGDAKARMVYKSQIVIKTPELTQKSGEVKRFTSANQNVSRVMTLEEKESPPNCWNIKKLNVDREKGQNISSILKDGKPISSNSQDQKENVNLKSVVNNKSAKLSPSTTQSNETRLGLKGKRKQGHSPQDENTHFDCKFEVISVETREFEQKNPDYCRPDLCGTQNSCNNPKQIFLRIPKCRQKNRNDKGHKAVTSAPNEEAKDKSPMSKKKCDRDMKLRVEIRSKLPLDIVDGRLKQFLKGIGGLIYYSPKDGGIPRIKELTNYFSGKQPLLWFSPRST